MSYKTDRLIALLPDVFATDSESLLYHLLDAVGAEFMQADESIKSLLRSHWVNYAEGAALDALGSIYSVERRFLRDGGLESDDAFRLRLKSVVDLFTGGGSVRAVKGAVRSALGLPFDLNQLNLPDAYQDLRDDIEALVVLEEFKMQFNTVFADGPQRAGDMAELQVSVDSASTSAERPEIQWRFTQGSGRHLSLAVSGATDGFQSRNGFIVPENGTLTLSADASGSLKAVLNSQDVTAYFTGLAGGNSTPSLPLVPQGHSDWTFRAGSGVWDESVFDAGLFGAIDSFGSSDADADGVVAPRFEITLQQGQKTPLEFDVRVPYFLKKTVEQLATLHNYPLHLLLVFEGLPPERIQDVVNQTRAAGVRGTVQFTLNLYDNHLVEDERRFPPTPLDAGLRFQATQQTQEDAGAREGLFALGTVDNASESHDMGEQFLIGGVFDRTAFDGSYGFAF